MKYTTAKMLHVLTFIVFSALPAYIIFSIREKTGAEPTIIRLVMATIIALIAKWAFIDGFRAVELKRARDEHLGNK